jgi:hypothetical protein
MPKIKVMLVKEFELDPESYPKCETFKEMYSEEIDNVENNEEIYNILAEEGKLKFEYIP